MKFLLCAHRKDEFFEMENGPSYVCLFGVSHLWQPSVQLHQVVVVVKFPKDLNKIVLKIIIDINGQQYSKRLQF